MLLDLYSYIGKVVYRKDFSKKKEDWLYFICGADKISNVFLCIPFSDFGERTKKYVMLDDVVDKDIISLSEAYDICSLYLKPLLELNRVFEDARKFDADKMEDFVNTFRRFDDTVEMLHHFKDYKCNSFMGAEFNEQRNQFIEKEKKKWQKGLRRIKKRTHHYFSDETFDFLVDNYKQKMYFSSLDDIFLAEQIKPYVEIIRRIEELLLQPS